MIDTTCNCGREGRYMHMIKGEQKFSCNKYVICPTYRELEEANKKIMAENSKLKNIKDTFSKLINMVVEK